MPCGGLWDDARSDCVVVDASPQKPGEMMRYLSPDGKPPTSVEAAPDGTLFVRLELDGRQFAIVGRPLEAAAEQASHPALEYSQVRGRDAFEWARSSPVSSDESITHPPAD